MCSVGRPAVSVAGLTACVGSLVAVAVDEEESSGDGSGDGDDLIDTLMPYVQPELICPVSIHSISPFIPIPNPLLPNTRSQW